MANQIIRPFSKQNGFTQFNNYIIDHIMPECSPNGWKVLCLIIRKTEGWNKEEDQLSLSQIQAGCGMGSRHTVISAIQDLEEKQFIKKIEGDRITSHTYSLNLDFEITIGSAEIAPPNDKTEGGSAESAPEGSAKTAPGVVQKLHTQKKQLKKTTKERTTSNEVVRGKSKKPKEKEKPKTVLRDRFVEITNLKMPTSGTNVGFWWNQLGQILNIYDGDVDRSLAGVEAVVRYMQKEKLSITSPKSIVGLCNAHAAGTLSGAKGANNERSRRNGQSGSRDSGSSTLSDGIQQAVRSVD